MSRVILPLLVALVACHSEPVAAIDPVAAAPAAETPVVAPVPVAVVAPAIAPVVEAPPVVGPTVAYRLGRGETLGDYAKWSGVPVEKIAAASGAPLDAVHQVGMTVNVPVDAAGEARLTERRDRARTARVEKWIASRHGEVSTGVYVVATGDTAWKLAHGEDAVPEWVLEAYNPKVNLDRLKPGQKLAVPIVTAPALPTVAEEVTPIDSTVVVADVPRPEPALE